MKNFISEFKEFALKGNAFNLAVGVIIGAAFQSIVNSLVKDMISPIIGLIVRQDFSDLSLSFLGITIRYGSFITAVINFFIMAIIIFMLVKFVNKLTSYGKETTTTSPTVKQCPYCCEDVDVSATRCPHCTSEL